MKLAINGGPAYRTDLFPIYNTIGEEEKRTVMQVLDTGNLSQFLGGYHDDFLGGPNVRQFEELWAEEIGGEFGISVNSNTSGLYTAIGAAGVGPGDEVIVSPYTMTASAIAPMIYGAVPVFADIDKNNFCLDPESVRSRITPRTKAILVVHIFGNPAKMDELVQIAKEHDLILIEDCAQAPFAEYKGKRVGTIGDMGIFSFNYHKHVHTGEGGIITTNNSKLAQRCQLIRNHGENVAGPMGVTDIHGLYGFNYRMPEMEAAIAVCQTKKLPKLIEQRIENVNYLNQAFEQMKCLDIPKPDVDCKHVYYVHPLLYKKEALSGLHRNKFVEAVKKEIPSSYLRETTPLIGAGYVRPLYLQPIYQQRAATCSFNCNHYDGTVSYEEGICPNTEWLYKETMITHEFMRPGMSKADLDDVIAGFQKVINHHEELL